MTLVVVDLQHVFADPSSEWAAPRFFDALTNVEALVAAIEDVVFTRFVAPAQPQGAWQAYYRQWPFALQPATAPMWDLVAPFTGRPTLDATTFGKWNSALADRAGGQLDICGVSTDCCVLSTVLAAVDDGVAVRVVTDACAGSSDDAHQQALTLMGSYTPSVELTTTAELLRSN